MIISGKEFKPIITEDQIKDRIEDLGKTISLDYKGFDLTIVAILNGSFIFAADLIRTLSVSCSITFVKFKSYEGISSTGKVNEILGIDDSLEGKNILILDDIIDTGLTINSLIEKISQDNPASIRVAALCFKPEVFKMNYPVDYLGFPIENKFIVGYGLDFDGVGRGLKSIYQLV